MTTGRPWPARNTRTTYAGSGPEGRPYLAPQSAGPALRVAGPALRARPLAAVAVCVAVVAAMLAAQSTVRAQDPQPMFRAVVDAVTIDAFVHHERQPLTGLTGHDFVVRDNGVEQAVDSIGTTDSAHVIVGLDLSGSVDGRTLDDLRAAVRALAGALTGNDRLSLFTFSDRVRLLMRAEAPGGALDSTLASMTAGGATVLHDAIVFGSALASADSRPSVFVLLTDGMDTGSWSSASLTVDAVRHTNVVIYPIGAGLPSVQIATPQSDTFTTRSWMMPTLGEGLRTLQRVADMTGGEFLRVNRRARFASTFAAILAQYRQRYLLTYVPTGAITPGWHRLDVRLRSRPGTVVAREGYMAR